MNKIDNLINELCPNGVEFKELGEVCNFKYGKGNTIPKTGGIYPIYGCNGIVGSHDVFNNEDSPIIGHIGTAGVVVWGEGKHFVTYNGTICKPKNKKLLSKYVYYNLLNLNLPSLTKGSQPFLSYGTIKKLKIPFPPLPIQEEIVRSLDNFTELEAVLEAELEARKKQYEYYRNELLTLEDDVEFKSMKELFDKKIIEAVSPPKKLTRNNYDENGEFPIIDQGQEFIVGYTNDKNTLVNNGEYVIFGDHTEAIKYVDFAFAQGADGIKIIKSNEIITKYLYYAINSFYEKTGKYTRHFSFLKKTEIPIPSITKQTEIVATLDKFNALVNDISIGLPAELEARKKQYEYYREKLLTFKEVKSNG